MPIYDFECCSCGLVQEVHRKFSDKLPEKAAELDIICCKKSSKVRRVFHPPSAHVEGSMSLGSLAEKNSKSLGASRVKGFTEQYKTKKDNTIKLKEGMSVSEGKPLDKKTADRINKINRMNNEQKRKFIQNGGA